jgi:hypothetical protein
MSSQGPYGRPGFQSNSGGGASYGGGYAPPQQPAYGGGTGGGSAAGGSYAAPGGYGGANYSAYGAQIPGDYQVRNEPVITGNDRRGGPPEPLVGASHLLVTRLSCVDVVVDS